MEYKFSVNVIGAGLAGCEAADRITRFGIDVNLYEMKPLRKSPAHKADTFAELVCSNSLRSDRIENAVGLLKAELREMDSLIMRVADATAVPAGGALAVDRISFSELITESILNNPRIHICHEIVSSIDFNLPTIIATGPLTSEELSEKIESLCPGLHFYDAAAPIVYEDSLDYSKVYRASRYQRGNDYLNCPFTEEEYFRFVEELINAETVELHSFETPRVFEGCMPVEVMAKRGPLTLAYGPLKPVGLEIGDFKPFAVVQLRQDNSDGTLYNIVGFQTNLKFPEQKRVFSMIPGLQNVEFARYGVMHRNTFINSPGFINKYYQTIQYPNLFFAGQITGVEGYVESTASGLLAGIEISRYVKELDMIDFTDSTAIGALSHYVSEYSGSDFQPMNITYGIMNTVRMKHTKKLDRYRMTAEAAIAKVKELKNNYNI